MGIISIGGLRNHVLHGGLDLHILRGILGVILEVPRFACSQYSRPYSQGTAAMWLLATSTVAASCCWFISVPPCCGFDGKQDICL